MSGHEDYDLGDVAAIREGLAQAERGETRPAEEFFAEFSRQLGFDDQSGYHFDSVSRGSEHSMAEVLVRDLSPEVVERLKQHARVHGRSLQAELKHILEREAARKPMDYLADLERLQARLGNRKFSDSAELIREDREEPNR